MKFKLHLLVAGGFLSISCCVMGQVATPTVTISNQAIVNQSISAQEAVVVKPQSTVGVTGPSGNMSRLYIDKTIQLPVGNLGNQNTSNFIVPQIDYTLPVGTITGSGNVTSSGQATYGIPIALPPGTNGMVPSLGISYNSGSSDGLLGRGWNISGVSAITRVPKTIYHDNVKAGVQLNTADVYALDGSRIISGRLENDNFSKITPLPNATNPTSFKVETKDGLTMEYGDVSVSPNSQLVLHVPTDVTYAWYLSRVYDKHNNYMLYDYYNAGGEVAIKEINYSGNIAANISPYNSVKFYYDIRADKREQYLLGNRMQRTLILREIQIVCETNFMKRYQFAYGYDDFYVQTFLNSITEQGSDFTKLNTTYIKYGEGTAPNASTTSIDAIIGASTTELPAVAEYRSGDFNGDGKSDLLAFEYNNIDGDNGAKTYTTCKLFINQGLTGVNNAISQFKKMASTSDIPMAGKFPYAFSDYMSDFGASPYGLQTADFNGDGKDDLLLGANAGGVITYTPYYANFQGDKFDVQTAKEFLVSENHAFVLADIDGDGKYEGVTNTGSFINVFWIDDVSQSSTSNVSGCGSCGPSSFSGLAAIDYDGDGRQDLVSTRTGKMAVLKINAAPLSSASVSEVYIDANTPSAYSERFFGDFNGDGITDNVRILLETSPPGNSTKGRIRFGTGKSGTGGYVQSDGVTPANDFNSMEEIQDAFGFYSERKYIVGDVNNDGKSDLVLLDYSPCSDGSLTIAAMLGGSKNAHGKPFMSSITLSGTLCAPPAFDYSNFQGIPPANSIAGGPFGDPNRPCNTWPGSTCGTSGSGFLGSICSKNSSSTPNPYHPYFPGTPGNTNHSYLIPEFVTGDFNGDAKQDIFLKTCGDPGNPGNYALIYFDKGSQNTQPTAFSTEQYVTSIMDGFRNKTTFKYAPLVDPFVASTNIIYTKGNNPQYPVIDFQQPLYVASQSSVSDGVGGQNVTSYTYDEAHVHLQGKGFLGFNTMTITTTYNTTPLNKIRTINEYVLNNAFKEKAPSKTETYTFPVSSFVKRTEEVYTPLLQGTGGGAHFTVMDKTVTTDILSGAVITVDPKYDPVTGNIKQSTTTIGNNISANIIETTVISSPTGGDISYTQAGSHMPNAPDEVMTTITRQEDNANPYPRTIKYTYDITTGDLTQMITDPDPGKTKKIVTNYNYDAFTGVLKHTDISNPNDVTPISRTLDYVYDTHSRFVTKTTNPIGQNSFATYDPKWGKPLTETGIDGLVTKYKYDGYGRNISITTPDNLTATTAYAWIQPGSLNAADYTVTAFGNDVISNALHSAITQRPGSPASRTIYDIYSRPIASDADGFSNKIFSASKYDAKGNIFKQCGAYENIANAAAPVITENLYDDLNRMVSTQNTSVNTTTTIPPTTFSYTFPSPKNGNTIVTTNIPAYLSTTAKKLIKQIDASGLLRSSEDLFLGVAAKITYSYYSHRQLKSTTLGPADVTNTITYDEYGMQLSLNEANSGTTAYVYDAYGRLTKQTDAITNVTELHYDLLDRITLKTVTPPAPGTADTYNYAYVTNGNGLNLLQSVSVNRQPANSTISSTYTYDNLNRITKVDENIHGPVFSTLFAYDQFSNIVKQTYPGTFAVIHDYTSKGYHLQIKRADNNQVIYHTDAMNALGQYTKYTLKIGAGLQTVKKYSDFGFPESFIAAGVQDLHFTFDPQNGNLRNRADGPLSEMFDYDNSDRLLTASGGSGVGVHYSPNGNIEDKSDATTGTNSYVYDPAKFNTLLTINDPTPNISLSLQGIIYSPFKKAQTITEDTYQLDFTYGPDDERKKTVLQNNSVLQSTRYFLGDYEETTDASGTTKVHYINCAGGLAAIFVISPSGVGALYYPYTDHLGSILKVVDEAGTTAAEQSFDAWGRERNPTDWTYTPNSSLPTPSWLYRGYTSHEHLPQFALINMNGRLYDPVVGRMLSADNNLQAPDYAQNHNRYSYALNNPLKFTDLSGNDVYTFNEAGDLQLVESQKGRDEFNIQGKDGIRGIKKKNLSAAMREIYNSTSSLLKSGEISGISFNNQGFYATVQAQILSGNDVSSSSSESSETDNYNYLVQPDPGDWRASQETWQTYGEGMQEFHDFMQDVIIEGVVTATTWDIGGIAMGAWKWLGRGAAKTSTSLGAGRTGVKQWLQNAGNLERGQLIKDIEGAGFKLTSPTKAPLQVFERGGMKIRLDPPQGKTLYNHMHLEYGGNSYNNLLNPVNFKSPAAHIPIR